MSYLDIGREALTGSAVNVLKMAAIVIPLMIFIEIFKDLNWLDRLTSIIAPVTRASGISQEGNLALMSGLLFGISYGSGVILQNTREGKLTYEDIFLINLFLVVCHSLFEDNLLFAAIGSRWLLVLVLRFVIAIGLCVIWRFFSKSGS
ncbi:MAG TPA: nucleoside recognition domain-containing protein [Syntrophomonadaceae bacterium]|nr:nucleoside recognition domain-containing protein [Syntrophomonadaceae bacterium]